MKHLIKAGLTALCITLTFPFWGIANLEKRLFRGDVFFRSFGQLLSLIPGLPGSFVRRGYYLGALENCAWEFHIDIGSFFAHRDVVVGHKAVIGAFSILGCVNLGREVLVASRVSITSGKNQHLDKEGNVVKEQTLEQVSIGEESWIGEGAVVMGNVGERCIISAGSVVTKDAPDDIIAVGNPARFMPRNRNTVYGKEPKAASYKTGALRQPG
jgi:acetyltransferase-like isoleucine patch superfamily enzyme